MVAYWTQQESAREAHNHRIERRDFRDWSSSETAACLLCSGPDDCANELGTFSAIMS
jgi:hypothetical protein